MKKFMVILILALCCICSTGCKKDKVNNTTDTISTYEITEEEVTYFEDSVTSSWDDINQEMPSVSPEYLEELEYNSRKNVYPEGMD